MLGLVRVEFVVFGAGGAVCKVGAVCWRAFLGGCCVAGWGMGWFEGGVLVRGCSLLRVRGVYECEDVACVLRLVGINLVWVGVL